MENTILIGEIKMINKQNQIEKNQFPLWRLNQKSIGTKKAVKVSQVPNRLLCDPSSFSKNQWTYNYGIFSPNSKFL